MADRSRWIRPLLGLAAYGALVLLERRRPLRRKLVRNARNVTLAGIGAAALGIGPRTFALLFHHSERENCAVTLATDRTPV